MDKFARNGPKWGQEVFPTNPDLADILGGTDLDFEITYYFFYFVGFQIYTFPGPQKSGLGQAWAGLGRAWAGLGRAWAGLGEAWAGLGWAWARLGQACARPGHGLGPCAG